MAPEVSLTVPQAVGALLVVVFLALLLLLFLGARMLSKILADCERIPPREWFARVERHLRGSHRQNGWLHNHEARVHSLELRLQKLDGQAPPPPWEWVDPGGA